MFYQRTRVPDVSAKEVSDDGVSVLHAAAWRRSVLDVGLLIIGIAFVISPTTMLAQRGGGGRGMMGGGGGAGSNRPSGVSDNDDLKNFHRALAIQATPDQREAFAKIAQYTQATSDRLRVFRESLISESLLRETQGKGPAPAPLADRVTTLNQSMEQARAGNRNFLSSFSNTQKSGLKDIAGKLAKADSELDKQLKTFDQIVQSGKLDSEQIGSAAAILDKEFASFQSEQLALGRAMGIVLPSDNQVLTFTLPKVTNSIDAGGQTISISASGAVTRTSAENGHNVFSLKVVANLSDIQQNMTGFLRSQLNRSPRCGERIEVQQATFTPLEPASQVIARVHYERWICPPGQGWTSTTEVANGNGAIEVKLTPAVEAGVGLRLASEITRVDGDGSLRNLLRSGDLGVTLREQIAASLLSNLQKAADLKAALPLTAQESATMQKAQFQNAGADQLNFLLEGQFQLSDEQTTQFAAQLKQRLSAQGTPAP